MSVKKISAIAGTVLIVGSLTASALGLLTWSSFWIIALFVAGFAWFVLPRMK